MRYDDGHLRGMHRRVAVAEPSVAWPASVVADLIDEIIRRRGTDGTWIVLHPEEDEI